MSSLVIDAGRERRYLRDLGRAFGGALLFNIPLLMTMEMWQAGIYMDRLRLLAFFAAALPVLYGLSYYAGFSKGRGLRNDVLDALVALAVGFAVASCLLLLFGVLEVNASPLDNVGMVALQAVPGAIGALVARRQMNGGDDKEDEGRVSYWGELFLMGAGALFFAMNVAPTEEMILIAYKCTPWHELGLIVVSVLLLHVIVYSAGFAGQEDQGRPVTAFFRFTLPGYAIAIGVSLFVLWVFGRSDGHAAARAMATAIVLGFPASIGAAAARLLV
ncbi:TIGR02587 family membrane protein [Brevundimonas sp. PAMC22021]|uniref:TIGR02587 family membrane protein n=1 Tax=Brevundimonas sp. PAMC22021 TaxID=2861285 RepID=UPI001C627579|nr:TIGR02587 family membrane protein [Brevundimonas sp. PAMC22021]QYF87136.1 TIGR02587 family membrane protein [Brevundimonas sp. PAMC22021]